MKGYSKYFQNIKKYKIKLEYTFITIIFGIKGEVGPHNIFLSLRS
jgi:hypothetical protein